MKWSVSSSGASTSSRGIQLKDGVGRDTRNVLAAPKGQDPPTRLFGAQHKGKSNEVVQNVAASRKGKGPLSGKKIMHKTLERRKGKAPQQLPSSQREATTSLSTRKRCLEESPSSPGPSPMKKETRLSLPAIELGHCV